MSQRPNQPLPRTRRERRGCNCCVPCAGSLLSLGEDGALAWDPDLTVDSRGGLVENVAMTLTAVLLPAPEGGYTAFNPETGSTTQGESVDEALANLREATALYLEEFPFTPTGGALLTTFDITGHG